MRRSTPASLPTWAMPRKMTCTARSSDNTATTHRNGNAACASPCATTVWPCTGHGCGTPPATDSATPSTTAAWSTCCSSAAPSRPWPGRRSLVDVVEFRHRFEQLALAPLFGTRPRVHDLAADNGVQHARAQDLVVRHGQEVA